MVLPFEADVLESLKKIQGGADGYALVDLERNTACYCAAPTVAAVDEAVRVQLRVDRIPLPHKDGEALPEILKHCVKAGYLQKPVSAPIYRVTYEGRTARAVLRRERLRMILNGVVFPILVSIGTTLLTLFLKGVVR